MSAFPETQSLINREEIQDAILLKDAPLITYPEALVLLRKAVSERQLRNLMRENRVSYHKPGKNILFNPATLLSEIALINASPAGFQDVVV